MKQTEIIAQLRSLRESQADFARTNGDEIFKRDVEALDAAIEALERIRWRKVSDELPEMERDRFSVDVLKLVVPRGYFFRGVGEHFPRCSQCGEEADEEIARLYCAYCGARMDMLHRFDYSDDRKRKDGGRK